MTLGWGDLHPSRSYTRLRYVRHSNGETYIHRAPTHADRLGRPTEGQVKDTSQQPSTPTSPPAEHGGQEWTANNDGQGTTVSGESYYHNAQRKFRRNEGWPAKPGGRTGRTGKRRSKRKCDKIIRDGQMTRLEEMKSGEKAFTRSLEEVAAKPQPLGGSKMFRANDLKWPSDCCNQC